MSGLNTALPGFVLASLFRTSLIDLPEEIKEESSASKATSAITRISYLGKNLQNILIGVSIAGPAIIPADALGFLTSVLKACQRSADDVAIVNFAHAEPTLEEIVSQLHPRMTMFFGSPPLYASLMPPADDFVPVSFQQVNMMRMPGLEQMMEGTAEGRVMKGRLWILLKQLFNL